MMSCVDSLILRFGLVVLRVEATPVARDEQVGRIRENDSAGGY
jgi:hypothetical protein